MLGRGVGRTVPPFAAVWRGLILRGGAVAFLRTAKFLKKIKVPEVVPKSPPLKTSLDVFKARKLLELARVSALL